MPRDLPPLLVNLLEWDKKISASIYRLGKEKYSEPRQHESYVNALKYLEYSCHGLPWLVAPLIVLYMQAGTEELWMNLMLALFIDLVIVASVKAFTRRRRPVYNNPDALTVSVDKFSFPSGHATRAIMATLFFNFLYPLNFVFRLGLVIWGPSVAVSRILLGRHHFLDVVAGVVFGIINVIFMSFVWMSSERSEYFAEYLFGDDPWSNA